MTVHQSGREIAPEPILRAHSALAAADPEMANLLAEHTALERRSLKLIASENFASPAVMHVVGSILGNKYAEGYPGKRYYEGNEVIDRIERLAQDRLKALFGAEHANVQPYSGSPANQAVYRALARPGDKVMGLPIPQGGHLTHGWHVNFSGRDFVQVPYGLHPETHLIDLEEVRRTARRERPKIIWVGGTAYPRIFDFAQFALIAKEVDAYLVADISHINGLIIGGVHPNPTPHAHVVSSTSHKSLRGPRGGFIMCRQGDPYQTKYHPDTPLTLAERVDRAVFPTLQGGPHMNQVGALAVALAEAQRPSFTAYAHQVVANARALAEALLSEGLRLVTGGTDNHMLILDLRAFAKSGKFYSGKLAQAGIVANFNMVPEDPRSPATTSGIRIGTPAMTTAGMTTGEMAQIARFIGRVIRDPSPLEIDAVRAEVQALCGAFPPPGYDAR